MNTGADPLTLFILVSAVLIYRTVDLVSTKVKLEQLAVKASWWTGEGLSFSVLRAAVRACKTNTRTVVSCFRLLMRIRADFVAGLMLLILALFAIVGYSVLLSEGVRTGARATLVVAVITALVSLIASVTNLLIEKVKIHL
jgi:hypothetical protein